MVSGISFRANSTTSARDIINKPQAQTRTTQNPVVDQPVKPKKKHTALKVIGGIVAAAAAVAVALGVTHGKGGFEALSKLAEKADTTKFVGKVTKWADSAAKACKLDTAGRFIADNATTAWNAVKGFFSKGETPAA